MVEDMRTSTGAATVTTPHRAPMPSHAPSGAALLALELNEEARGVKGLDVLRRTVDRAPPTQS